ncbi:MAG: 1-phosphofructokinase [Planctomycetaceae bacterium]
MILNLGMSPAWQQILHMNCFREGEVNRARESIWCASGKVLNVARALKCLSVEAMTISTAGGISGQQIHEEFTRDSIPARWIPISAPSRVCTTILDETNAITTELVEETAPILDSELNEVRQAFSDFVSSADLLVISGSFPKGTPETFCRDLLKTLSVPAVLDIRGPQLLNALQAEPWLVKPNREELAMTLQRNSIPDAELQDAMRELNNRGAEWVVITQGSGAVWLSSKEDHYRIQPPEKSHVVNPIGCGDCLTAGIAAGKMNGMPPVEAVQLGIAAAVCNLQTARPARFTLEDVQSVFQSVFQSAEGEPLAFPNQVEINGRN